LSYLGNVVAARARRASHFDSVTEPSGQGDYAEAMRELIAELRPGTRGLYTVLGSRLAPRTSTARFEVTDNGGQRPARRGHLRVVS